MKTKAMIKHLISTAIILTALSCSAQKTTSIQLTAKEKTMQALFDAFMSRIYADIDKNKDLNDSTELAFFTRHYVFINADTSIRPDHSPETFLTVAQKQSLQLQLNNFYQFVLQRKQSDAASLLTVKPVRLSNDSFVYAGLTAFQKENTFVLYDRNEPAKTLAYMLFVPPMNKAITSPKIWSWNLMYGYGKFYFKSITGEEGYELAF